MKKIFVLILVTVQIFLTVGCNNQKIEDIGVWISCYELDTMLKEDFKTEFSRVITNCAELKIKNLYIHTRAFGDSLYQSDYFPIRKSVKNYEYDVFDYILGECKKANIKVHAWINPYRIRTSTTDITKLEKTNPAYLWLTDNNSENDGNIAFSGGIYLNPASMDVKNLVLDGIRELLAKYDVDGVHFDDYFYPTTNIDFDKASYSEYSKKSANPLSLADWRRENVNTLIKECKKIISYADKNIIFSISPSASLEQNYNELYADVGLWIKQGYVDEIIPQLYFGFEYPIKEFRFENLLLEWKTLARENSAVKLKIGLGVYKSKPNLKADKAEWSQSSDIISRQASLCANDIEIDGYVLFSYSTLFSNEKEFKAQRENLKKFMDYGEIL